MFAVQVYGKSVLLNCTEGSNCTLPDKMMGSGTLRWNNTNVLTVTDGKINQNLSNKTLSGRLFWNSSTGEITLINVQRNDSGELVLSIKCPPAQTYNLTVDEAPTGNEPWWLRSVPVPVLVLILVPVLFSVLFLVLVGYLLYKNRRSAADSTPTANGNMESIPMMPLANGNAVATV